MTKINSDEALAWARGQEAQSDKVREFFLYLWHRKISDVIGRPISWLGLFLFLLRIVTIFAIASSVIWLRIGDPNYAVTRTDKWLIVVLAGFMLFSWVADTILARRKTRKLTERLEQDVAMDMASVIDKMSEFIAQFSKETASDIIQEQFRHILQCVEYKARIYLQREDSNYFNVSLLVFAGTNGKKLAIKSRSNLKRKLVDNKDATKSAAYYVAKAQKARVIHDFKEANIFPQRGLSDSSIPYRSILLLPLIPVTIGSGSDSAKVCRAVVSIDSEKAYEFWGSAVTDIQVQMRPFLSVLNLMLTEQSEGVPVDEA